MHSIGFIDRAPYAMDPTKPFGVPALISLAFWGGVWGIILGLILERMGGAKYWLLAMVIGAIAPTLVAAFVVAPLKGVKFAGNPAKLLVAGLVINAVWGLTTAAFYRLMAARRR